MTNQLQMQPTFRVDLPWEMDDAKNRLRRAIRTESLSQHANAAGSVIDFQIEPDQKRFWSPHLSVQLNASDLPQYTEAHCRFSPRPEIWTMVMAIYMVASCCLFGSGIYGFVQWAMGNPPWALVVAPISVLAILCLHVASMIGQGWSHDQMRLLRSRWEMAVEIAGNVGPVSDDAQEAVAGPR